MGAEASTRNLVHTWVRDMQDAAHGYVVALDRVLARAHDVSPDQALRQLAAVPCANPRELAFLLERKRRELLERRRLARHQHLRLPPRGPDFWPSFFCMAAEMAGAPGVEVDGALGHAVVPARDVPALEGDFHSLSYAAPNGAHAALQAVDGWLTLAAPPWLFEQTLRELDRRTGLVPLDLALSYDLGREIQEGSGLEVRLSIRNLSDDVVVLESLSTDHPYDPPLGFSQAALGRLVHDEAMDRYCYDALAPGATAGTFHTAVLLPGEERVQLLTLKLLEGGECWREVHLRYRRFSREGFRRQAYVPMQEVGEGFPPRLYYGAIAALQRPDTADLASVLLGGDLPTPGELTWAYPFHVGRRAFSLAQARNRLPDGSEPVHYSRWQQAWVMRVDEGSALVSPSRVTLYPTVDPRAFILIDEAEQRVPIRFADGLLPLFRSLPLGITDWESHALGLSVSLPKLKLTSFFQEAERLGVSLGLGENMLGRGTLVVGPRETIAG